MFSVSYIASIFFFENFKIGCHVFGCKINDVLIFLHKSTGIIESLIVGKISLMKKITLSLDITKSIEDNRNEDGF